MSAHRLPQALNDLYQLSLWQKTLYSAPKVHGILFGVSCVPEIPMPETWLGYVFNQHSQIPSEAALEQLTKVLMDGLSQVLAAIHKSDYTFCEAWSWDDSELAMFADFLQGVLLVHQAQEKQWQKAWDTMPETAQVAHSKTLQQCLSMMTTFADVPLAISKKSPAQQPAFISALPQLFLSLPNTIERYVGLSGQVASYLPNQFEQFTQR
ncbi:MAG: UPF0149 family protein [Glaciecola sp.]